MEGAEVTPGRLWPVCANPARGPAARGGVHGGTVVGTTTLRTAEACDRGPGPREAPGRAGDFRAGLKRRGPRRGQGHTNAAPALAWAGTGKSHIRAARMLESRSRCVTCECPWPRVSRALCKMVGRVKPQMRCGV